MGSAPSPTAQDARQIGDKLLYRNEWHAVANVDRNGTWLISLERRNAVPFLAADLAVSESATQSAPDGRKESQ